MTSIFSREIDDEVISTLFYGDGSTAQVSVNWSDESYRKMTTKVSLWGTGGRIYADRQECQVYLARHGSDPARLPTGLERPLHDRAHGAGLASTFAARSTAPSSTASSSGSRAAIPDGPNGFDSAAATDRVIAMMVADAAKGVRDAGDRGVGRRAEPRAALPAPAAERHEAVAVRRVRAERREGGGPAALRRQPVLRRQPHVRGEGPSPGDAVPGRSTRSSTSSTPPTTRASAPSCARRTIGSAVCDHVRADPDRYRDFTFYPCMPYAHKYANAVTENGMLGAVRRFLPDEGLLDAALRGGASVATKDIEGLTTLLIDAEMKMFDGLSHPGHLPAERRRRPAARPRLQGRLPGLRRPRRATATTPSRASSR